MTHPQDPEQQYPHQVCLSCGQTANHMHRIKQYGKMATVSMNQGAFGAWRGRCDVCGQNTTVTSPRDFFYPDQRAFNYLRRYVTKGKL